MRDMLWPIVVLFLLAAILRSELFFYLLYLVAGLHIAVRLWIGHSARQLRIVRHAPHAAFPGEYVPVTLELQNTGLLPIPWLSLHETLPPALHTPPMVREVVSLGAGEQHNVHYTLASRRRGYYCLGPLALQTGDVLGVGERTLAGLPTVDLTIYPAVLPLADLGLPASLPFGVVPTRYRLFTDPARPAGVRPYQAADGVRRIDWKATARAGEPQVRRYQPAIAVDMLVALAFSRAEYGGAYAYDTMECALTAAASIAAHLIARRQAVGLCTTGIDAATSVPAPVVPPGAGRPHLMQVLGVLGRLEPARDGNLGATLLHATAGLGWGSTVMIVTGQRASGVLPDVLALRRRGLNAALVIAEATADDLGLARRHGIVAYALRRDGRPQPA